LTEQKKILGIIKKGSFVLHFREIITGKFEFSKDKNCRKIRYYGNYHALIGLLFSQNNRYNSVFNRILDYFHGALECLTNLD